MESCGSSKDLPLLENGKMGMAMGGKIRNENEKISRTRCSSVSRGDHRKSKVAVGNKKQLKNLFGSGCLTVAWSASSHTGAKRSQRRTVESCGDRKVTLLSAPMMKTFQKCIFRRWKMKNGLGNARDKSEIKM